MGSLVGNVIKLVNDDSLDMGAPVHVTTVTFQGNGTNGAATLRAGGSGGVTLHRYSETAGDPPSLSIELNTAIDEPAVTGASNVTVLLALRMT